MVDDMISSGESMIDVCKQLKEKGAARVFCFATFGLFTDGFAKFDQAAKDGIIDKVLTTNLVYRRPELAEKSWYVEVNMCKYVAYLIDTLNNDESLSALLNPVKRIQTLIEKHRSAQAAQMQMTFDDKL